MIYILCGLMIGYSLSKISNQEPISLKHLAPLPIWRTEVSTVKEEMVLIQDDDCHWYLIPYSRKKEFNQWDENFNEESDPDLFSEYYLNRSYSDVIIKDYRLEE